MCRKSDLSKVYFDDGPLVHVRTRRSRSAHREKCGESSVSTISMLSNQISKKYTNVVDFTQSTALYTHVHIKFASISIADLEIEEGCLFSQLGTALRW